MISENIKPGTIVIDKVFGQGIFKSFMQNGNAIAEFEDGQFAVLREDLTALE